MLTAQMAGPVRIQVIARDLLLLVQRLRGFNGFFRDIVDRVRPEFGAYMWYSSILEARHPTGKGQLQKAVLDNLRFIQQELGQRLVPIAVRYARSGAGNRGAAQAEVERVWEDVLNRDPRIQAMRTAPVLYGFHRNTIRGYGRERPLAEVNAEMRRLHQQREAARIGRGSHRTRSNRSTHRS